MNDLDYYTNDVINELNKTKKESNKNSEKTLSDMFFERPFILLCIIIILFILIILIAALVACFAPILLITIILDSIISFVRKIFNKWLNKKQ